MGFRVHAFWFMVSGCESRLAFIQVGSEFTIVWISVLRLQVREDVWMLRSLTEGERKMAVYIDLMVLGSGVHCLGGECC